MGCEGMQSMILKGPVHQAVDGLVNKDTTTRAAFLAALKALQPAEHDHTQAYLEILQSYTPQLVQPINYLAYLHDTWYNPQGSPPKTALGLDGFWSAEYHPTEPIIRQGLIKAIELAIEKS